MEIAGLIISFVGTILMIPESLRLSKKNKENVLSWDSNFPCANVTPHLFVAGIIILAIGFIFQFIGICTR